MTSTLTSLAILKVNSDRLGQDILDNFVPLVADRLYHSGAEVASVPDIRADVSAEYGLNIPGGALKTILGRCRKRKLLRHESGVWKVCRDELAIWDLTSIRNDMVRQHSDLVAKGVAFADATFGTQVSAEEFGQALQHFIQAEAAPLLSSVVDGRPIFQPANPTPNRLRFLVASFLMHLRAADAVGFSYLSAVVKGSALASALYFPEVSSINRKLDRLAIYLDTKLLLRAIGACGPDHEIFAAELLNLAGSQGARPYCFEHTVTEIRGVLNACLDAVRRRSGTYFGEATEFMIANGWEASDVIALDGALESRLMALGVGIRSTPAHQAHLTLDEDRIEKILDTETRYPRRSGMVRDIDSVSAIHRLRGGKQFRNMENARAIFVTTNLALVRAARKYARIEDIDNATVPWCVPDHTITTLFWLKQPLAHPQLPERQVIADCYAAMRPSEEVWLRYVEKIEALHASGSVTTDDYVMLRQDLQTRSLIMYVTDLSAEAFTEATANLIATKARENIARDALDDAANAKQAATVARAEIVRKSDELDRIEGGVDQLATRFARIGAYTITAFLAGASFVTVALTTPWPGFEAPKLTGIVAALVFVAIVISVGLSLLGGLVGWSLGNVATWLARKLRAPIHSWLTRSIGTRSKGIDA